MRWMIVMMSMDLFETVGNRKIWIITRVKVVNKNPPYQVEKTCFKPEKQQQEVVTFHPGDAMNNDSK